MRTVTNRLKRLTSQPSGQTAAEFALVLPVLLLVVFIIIEGGRLLHAWMAVENGARFGVRYAVTGEYEPTYFDDTVCANFYAAYGQVCDTVDKKENAARVLSIRDAVRVGATAILRDETRTWDEPAYFNVTLCSTRATPGFVYTPPDPGEWVIDWSSDCAPYHDAGGPGNRVVITADFNHPLILPFLSSAWPWLHLTATREGRVEQFRVSRIVGIDPTLVLPSPTPLPTNTPTETFTPLPTATASDTATPTSTATTTSTPTITPTPTCSGVSFGGFSFDGNAIIRQFITNTTYPGLEVTGVTVYWTSLENTRAAYGWNPYIDWMQWNGVTVRNSNDSTSSTSANQSLPRLVNIGTNTIRIDWDGVPIYRLSNSPINLSSGNFGFSVTFSDSNCNLFVGQSVSPLPTATNTPTPTMTYTPSNTPPPSNTPLPSNTPTITLTPSRTPTRTPSRTPTITPIPSNTPIPSITPIPSSTNTSGPPTQTATPTATDTPPPFEF